MSLKGDKYETHEEVQFRLANTVVLYDGKPVYITRIGFPGVEDKKEIARVFFVDLPHGGRVPEEPRRLRDRGEDALEPVGKEQRKFLSSKNFDLAPFKMGYFNNKGVATFVSRNPVRQNRQGLSRETTVLTCARGRRSENMNFANMIAAQGFVDMVAGNYPRFADIGDLLLNDNEHSSVAVSRSFAVVIDNDLEALILMHKGTKCGLALKGDKALRIAPKFHFLKQEAEEYRIPLA